MPLGGSDTQLARETSLASSVPLPVALPPQPGTAAAAAAAAAPASSSGVMSRAPQKYLIQNQSGIKVYYWAAGGRVSWALGWCRLAGDDWRWLAAAAAAAAGWLWRELHASACLRAVMLAQNGPGLFLLTHPTPTP